MGLNATWIKIEQNAIGLPYLFDRGANKQVVFEYLRTTQTLMETEHSLELIIADPAVTDKETASAQLRANRDALLKRQELLAPLAEATLQGQISEVLAELNLTTGGQPFPPVLYHTSPTPLALVGSRRNVIAQIAHARQVARRRHRHRAGHRRRRRTACRLLPASPAAGNRPRPAACGAVPGRGRAADL